MLSVTVHVRKKHILPISVTAPFNYLLTNRMDFEQDTAGYTQQYIANTCGSPFQKINKHISTGLDPLLDRTYTFVWTNSHNRYGPEKVIAFKQIKTKKKTKIYSKRWR